MWDCPPWQSWYAEAACKGQTALFFGPHNEQAPEKYKRERQAKRICANCPVRIECHDYAVKYKLHGVWGCTTDNDRKRAYWADKRRRWRDAKREAS